MSDTGIATRGTSTRAERPEKQEDDDDDDEHRLDQGVDDVVDGAVDVRGGVEGDDRVHAGGKLGADDVHLPADAGNDIDRVGVGQHPDAHEYRLVAREPDVGVVGVGAQDDVGDVLETHERVALAPDHELAELVHRLQVGRCGEVDLDERPLGLPHGGQVVVGRERLPHLRRAHVQGRHLVRLEPGADGEGLPAEDLGPLNAFDGRQPRLDDPDEVVGDLVLLEDGGAEAQVHRRDLGVRWFDVDGGDLGLGGQVGAHLVHAGADVGQSIGRIEVELQAHADRRQPLDALRLDVVDAVGRGDRALERRSDEPAYELRVGPDVHRAHAHRGALELGVLPHVERADGLKPGDDDDEVDDDRQHGPANEDVGEPHGLTGSLDGGRERRSA